VTEATVATEIHQPLDVQRDVTAQVTFDAIAIGDDLPQSNDLLVRQLFNLLSTVYLSLRTDLLRGRLTDPEDVRECHPSLLPARKVYT
jgi:hypothetical protein